MFLVIQIITLSPGFHVNRIIQYVVLFSIMLLTYMILYSSSYFANAMQFSIIGTDHNLPLWMDLLTSFRFGNHDNLYGKVDTDTCVLIKIHFPWLHIQECSALVDENKCWG